MIPLKMFQMQGTEIRLKVKGQRAIVINPFQLSASGFQLLSNAADRVFSAESFAEYEKDQSKDYTQKYRSCQGKIKGEVVSPDYKISWQLAQKRNLGA